MRRLRVVAVAVAAVVLPAGCGGGNDPGGAPTGPPPAPGFSRVIGLGFTIDVPARWQQPQLDPGSFDAAASALRDQNPQLARALEQARASAGSGGSLFAIDPADGSTVNLIVTSRGGRSLDDLVAAAAQELTQVGVTSVRDDRATIGDQDARRLHFELPVRGPSGSLNVPEVQYYAVRGDRLFILTLFGTSPDLPAIAESLRLR